LKLLRYLAFASAIVLALAAIYVMAAFPKAIPMELPESRAGVQARLSAAGSAPYAAGVRFDQTFIVIYAVHIAAWVAWVALGVGKIQRSAIAAAAGTVLMVIAAAYWDYIENARMLAVFQAFDAGTLETFDLGPLRTAAARKWGYLGYALVLAGIANGFGMWVAGDSRWGPRRIRTWACIAGGIAGITGGSALLPQLAAATRWGLFNASSLGLSIALLTVVVETRPGRTSMPGTSQHHVC
jgi:hypothetical protein